MEPILEVSSAIFLYLLHGIALNDSLRSKIGKLIFTVLLTAHGFISWPLKKGLIQGYS